MKCHSFPVWVPPDWDPSLLSETEGCQLGKQTCLLIHRGQPLKLRVNIHEHNPSTGHYVTKSLMPWLQMMKQHSKQLYAFATIRKTMIVSMNFVVDTDFMYIKWKTNVKATITAWSWKRQFHWCCPEWQKPHMDNHHQYIWYDKLSSAFTFTVRWKWSLKRDIISIELLFVFEKRSEPKTRGVQSANVLNRMEPKHVFLYPSAIGWKISREKW